MLKSKTTWWTLGGNMVFLYGRVLAILLTCNPFPSLSGGLLIIAPIRGIEDPSQVGPEVRLAVQLLVKILLIVNCYQT